MSGGSFNYLFSADSASQLGGKEEDLERMAETLAKLGYAPDAAQETFELLLELRAFDARLKAHHSRLWAVWRAVERWRSGDSGEDFVKEMLALYRSAR